MDQMEKQAARFGAEILPVHVTRVDLSSRPYRVWAGDQEWRARTVVIATGATAKWLGIPGEEKLRGRGRLRVRHLRRLLLPGPGARGGRRWRLGDGGGDLPHEVRLQGDDRPSARRVPRIEDHAGARPREPQDRGRLEHGGRGDPRRGCRHRRAAPRHRRRASCESSAPTASSSRSATPRTPSSSPTGWSSIDDGYIVVREPRTHTSIDGVFAAGDVTDRTYRQAVTAAGQGCKACDGCRAAARGGVARAGRRGRHARRDRRAERNVDRPAWCRRPRGERDGEHRRRERHGVPGERAGFADPRPGGFLGGVVRAVSHGLSGRRGDRAGEGPGPEGREAEHRRQPRRHAHLRRDVDPLADPLQGGQGGRAGSRAPGRRTRSSATSTRIWRRPASPHRFRARRLPSRRRVPADSTRCASFARTTAVPRSRTSSRG